MGFLANRAVKNGAPRPVLGDNTTPLMVKIDTMNTVWKIASFIIRLDTSCSTSRNKNERTRGMLMKIPGNDKITKTITIGHAIMTHNSLENKLTASFISNHETGFFNNE